MVACDRGAHFGHPIAFEYRESFFCDLFEECFGTSAATENDGPYPLFGKAVDMLELLELMGYQREMGGL